MWLRRFFLIIVVLVVLPTSAAYAQSAEEDLSKIDQHVQTAIQYAQEDQLEESYAAYKQFSSGWFEIEDGIKAKSKQMYGQIEDAMGMAEFIHSQSAFSMEKWIDALNELSRVNTAFIQGSYEKDSTSGTVTVGTLLANLKQARAEIQEGELQRAADEVQAFKNSWLEIEALVLTQSEKVYGDTERDMVRAYAYLTESPPDAEAADRLLDSMIFYLEPLSAKSSYTMFDAVSILLREGLEALLVIVALLAFLTKSGHGEKKKWVWSGVGAGLGVSLLLGVFVQLLFSKGVFGSNNFLIAGLTGLFAAVMLLYMTYWLHSKSSIAQWNSYIRDQSVNALRTGSLWSLAILSFLAVFREGTETVLFLIGMASSISMLQLVLGIGMGLGLIAVLAFAVLKLGVKIPIRPFFLVSSLVVFYLCFKFAGMGVQSLQISGHLPATHLEGMPSMNWIALYPTMEGLIPQLLLLLSAAGIFTWNKWKERKLKVQHSSIN